MPFLFAWILSTYISIRIFLKIYENKNVSLLNFFFLSLSTSFLSSIRITGILILLQYLITFIIASNLSKTSFYKILKFYSYKIFLFFLFTLFLIILFYPIFWKNPLIIFEAINRMKDYPYGVCTLTLGKCMHAMKLPYNYIFIWLFFKLPFLSLVGLILFPFTERKIFSQPIRQIILGSILLTLISIISILIFLEANLYDELRHILYIVPLILIISFSTIYFFSKKMLLYITFLSIFSFSIQNIYMYPYQYRTLSTFNIFGVTCQLVYIEKVEEISSVYDNIPDNRSVNAHRRPQPSYVRENKVIKEVEKTEDIKLKVYWDSKSWTKIGVVYCYYTIKLCCFVCSMNYSLISIYLYIFYL